MNSTRTSPVSRASGRARMAPETRPKRRDDAVRNLASFSYRQDAYDLVLNEGSSRIQPVLRGEAEFALIVEGPLILIAYRFGHAGHWSIAPFTWLDLPRSEQIPPRMAEDRALLSISMKPSRGQDLQPVRNLTLSLDFTRALNDAVRERAKFPANPIEESRALDALRCRFTTAQALLARALVRSAGIP